MAEPEPIVLPGPYGGHPGSVLTVAYSPDGALLASGGWDGTVRLWNSRTGVEVSVLAGHVGPVRSIAFAPDGTMLASAGRDRTIRLWDLAARTSVGVLRGHAGAVLSVVFAPDGGLLASAGDDGTVRLWDPRDGAQAGEFPDDSRAVAFCLDGKILASAGRDGGIRRWNLADRTHTTVTGNRGTVLSAVFAPDGGLLASAGDDGTVRLSDPRDGAQVAEFPDDSRAVALSVAGQILASAGRDGGIRLWDLAAGARPTSLDEARQSHCLAFAPDGSQLASAGDGGDICVYDLAGAADPMLLVGHTCEILSATYSPDGTLLATGDVDGTIRIWETTHGTLAHRLAGDREWVRSLAFSRSGDLLAAAIGDRIRVWDVTAGFAPGMVADRGRHSVTSVAFGPASADVSLLVSADQGGQLTTWNARDGAQTATMAVGNRRIVSVAIDLTGTLIASAGNDGFVRRCDLSLSAWGEFMPGIDQATCVALHPAGQLLAGAGADAVIRLWNVADPAAPVATLRGHEGVVRALAFSADGALLASGGGDSTVRLWDARNGSAIRILAAHAGVVRSVAFTPDSTMLVSVGDDGRINIWNARTGALMRGGRPVPRPMPPVPGVRSDDPSQVDLLGMADDVQMLATLIAAAGTEPPLAVALLGEWGAGKSSVMLQVHDAVARLAARTRRDPGNSSYAGNVWQVRFNAWHYSDERVWTGLIDHLFRGLAAAADGDQAPPTPAEVSPEEVTEERDRLRQELKDQQARCAQLDSQQRRTSRRLAALSRMAWRDRRRFLSSMAFAALALALFAFHWLSGVAMLIGRAWNLGGAGQRRVADWSANSLERDAREAQDRLAALEDQLAQVDAAVRLARLLNRHGDLDPYGGGRGLLGQVHHDLEQLAADLDRLRKERQVAGQLVPPPLERIVLYIDDLDRCPPARVVEVLAAVHLMLALPLFVVIVAVDPRWLLAALRHHYRELFAENGGADDAAGIGDSGPGERTATPLDYLDKIFQIPFTVRPPSAQDTASFLATLLGHDPADQPAAGQDAVNAESRESGRPVNAATTPQPAGSRLAGPPPPGGKGPVAPADRPSPALSAREAGPDLRPGSLVLRTQEAEFMVRLGPLLTTPRAAKKLVNLYRLVRIGIPEEELPAFIGPGGYQVVQVLLAVLVGAPDAAPAIFAAIRTAAHDADIVGVVGGAGPAAGTRIAGVIDGIRRVTPEAIADIRAYQRWCPTLARYSFHTRSLAEL